MRAVEVLSAEWTVVCYSVALALFVLAACNVSIQRVNLVAAGLAVVTFVAAWNEWAAT